MAAAICGPLGQLQTKHHKNEAFPLTKIMYSTSCVEWAVDHFGLGLT